ncbi:gamma-glutamyltransferase [bacterium]|nr:gamma-glutamyltransferase [bacterium]
MRCFALTLALLFGLGCSASRLSPMLSPKAEQLFSQLHNIRKNPHLTVQDYVAVSDGAMIASESREASAIGAAILERGGNAIDAAIATSFALAVIRPQATGIGGGGFALYTVKGGEPKFLDMRERAPAAATRSDYFSQGKYLPERSRFGGTSVGVPGLVAGLSFLYEHYRSGAVSWSELVLPAARLAERGFVPYPHFASSEEWLRAQQKKAPLKSRVALLHHLSSTANRYRNPALGKTLRTIARSGKSGFYSGAVADSLVDTVQRFGGRLTKEDLHEYEVYELSPLRRTVREHEIFTAPPPSSGGIITLQALAVLSQYDSKHPLEVSTLALRGEVLRRAFAYRATAYGDPRFVQNRTEHYLSDTFIAELSQHVHRERFQRANDASAPETPRPSPGNTTHFSIIDRMGNAISSTQSVNYFFGSGLLDPQSGVLLNNTLDDFSFQAGSENSFGLLGGEANQFAPKKTPLSSMTPTLVQRDGEVVLALGSPGGPRIISAVTNVLAYSLLFDLPPAQSVFAPRVHHQWSPDILVFDSGHLSRQEKQLLEDHGAVMEETDYGIGAVSAVFREGPFRIGVSDPRREPGPLGINP